MAYGDPTQDRGFPLGTPRKTHPNDAAHFYALSSSYVHSGNHHPPDPSVKSHTKSMKIRFDHLTISLHFFIGHSYLGRTYHPARSDVVAVAPTTPKKLPQAHPVSIEQGFTSIPDRFLTGLFPCIRNTFTPLLPLPISTVGPPVDISVSLPSFVFFNICSVKCPRFSLGHFRFEIGRSMGPRRRKSSVF